MATPFYFTPNNGTTAISGGIRYVDSSGIIHSPMLTSSDAVFNANAPVGSVCGICFDSAKNFYVTDPSGCAIYKVTPSFVATHVLGQVGTTGVTAQAGIPGLAASASLAPTAVAIDAAGNLYIADSYNFQILAINMQPTTQVICNVSIPAGNIAVIAGTGVSGFSGDGGQATLAQLFFPGNSSATTSNVLALDASGNVYFLHSTTRIRKIDQATGVINTIIGTGTQGGAGDGGPALSATIDAVGALACDAQGNVIWSQVNIIRAANFSGSLATIFGVSIANGNVDRISGQSAGGPNGIQGYSGDGGAATAAKVAQVDCFAIDSATGAITFGFGGINTANCARIRAITTAGIISTVAGNGTSGTTGDGGSALSAEIQESVFGLAFGYDPAPPPPPPPQTLVTVFGGSFQDASGAPLSNGKLTLRLLQDIELGTSQIAAGIVTTLALDATGNVTPSPGAKLWGPSSYQVVAYTAQGLAVWSGKIAVPNVTSFSLTP